MGGSERPGGRGCSDRLEAGGSVVEVGGQRLVEHKVWDRLGLGRIEGRGLVEEEVSLYDPARGIRPWVESTTRSRRYCLPSSRTAHLESHPRLRSPVPGMRPAEVVEDPPGEPVAVFQDLPEQHC